jgi:hypothetical protein
MESVLKERKRIEESSFINLKDILVHSCEFMNTDVYVCVRHSRFKLILSQYLSRTNGNTVYTVDELCKRYTTYSLSKLDKNNNVYILSKSCTIEEEDRTISTCATCGQEAQLEKSECFYCKTIKGENYLKQLAKNR